MMLPEKEATKLFASGLKPPMMKGAQWLRRRGFTMVFDWLGGTTANAHLALSGEQEQGTTVPALTILYHANPERLGDVLLLGELAAGRKAEISRTRPLFTLTDDTAAPLADPFISRQPLVFSKVGTTSIQLHVPANGTAVLADGRPVNGNCLFSAKEVERGIVLELAERVILLLHMTTTRPRAPQTYGLIGDSMAMAQVRSDIERVADLPTSVLLRGETGTGKELVAQAIHENGKRRTGPFLGVNMGAIPTSLAASELFGTERGAYTGANSSKKGLFQAAHGGTLFMDEVGEAPAEIQVMLLRVLETGEVFPIGAQHPRTVDIRLLAATDARLEEMSVSGTFRAPLLHRLSGYEIWLPPLRKRREDFGQLLAAFLKAEAEALGEKKRLAYDDPHAPPWLPAPLVGRLARYSWPGNVRQLKNVIRQLVIGNRGMAKIVASPALEALLNEPSAHDAPAQPLKSARIKPSAISDDVLLEALRHNRWEVKATAAWLGISRTSLHSRLDKCDRMRKAIDLGLEELTACFQDCDGDLNKMVDRLEVSRSSLARRLKELRLD